MSVGARTLTLVAEQSNNVARGAEDGGWQQTLGTRRGRVPY